MTIFNTDQVIDQDKDYYSEFVGEGKKYKDNAAAGRALAEKDAFIDRLKAEAAGVRQELSTRLKLEEVVEKIALTAKPSNEDQQVREPNVDAVAPLTSEAVQQLVAKTLTDSERESRRASNLVYVEDRLKEAFGPTYNNTITTQAVKLGLGVEFLKGLAADQPGAFLKLMDVGVQQGSNSTATSAPRSSISSESLVFKPDNTVKRMSHYEAIRKKDPKTYWSSRVQNEIHAEGIRQGQSFFD